MIKYFLLFLLSLFKKKGLGLKELPFDSRDLQLGSFWRFGVYTPKHSEYDIPTITVKTQGWNTCSFNSATAGKEVDEQTILSVRFLVAMAKKEGLVSGDGFANLRASEAILSKYGCCEEKLLPSNNLNVSWEEWSEPAITQEMLDNASLHKSKSYFFVSNYNQAIEQIENGHPVKFGVSWRTNMNMNGGFSFPWLLNFFVGYVVGGHAILARGHNQNYQGKKVLKCQNSYGKTYGDNGCMYITESDFNREALRYGATVNLDLEKDVARWLIANNGKVVKSPLSSCIYLIESGKKRKFTDLAVFYAHGFVDEVILVDNEAYIPLIEDGDDMVFWDGSSVRAIKAIIQQRQNLRTIFDKYFSELFT